MTEQEAKAKWCPFARVAVTLREESSGTFYAAASANRVPISEAVAINGATDRLNPESARCLGSACMAWRWIKDGWTLDFEGVNAVFRRAKSGELHGYCGLAGEQQ